MAHALEFHYDPKNGGDPCDLRDIAKAYIDYRSLPIPGTSIRYRTMDVADMLTMALRPEGYIDTLAAWVADCGTNDMRYDLSKFGYWDCSECGADDIGLGSYDDDCDEE